MVPDLTWLGTYWYCSKYQIIKKINVGNKIAAIFKTGGLDFEYIVHCVSCAYLPYYVQGMYYNNKSQLGL